MNENKDIDISPIKIAQWVGSKAQDGKMRWVMIAKTIMGVIFNLQNSQSSISSLPYFHLLMKSAFLVSEGLLCLYEKQNDTWFYK